MNSFIQFTLTEKPELSFQQPDVSGIKQEFPQLTTFDLDNHSEEMIVGYAQKLMDESKKVVFYIKASEVSSQGGLMKLLSRLVRKKKSALLILEGKNALAEKMGKAVQFHQGNPEKQLLTDFLG